MLRGITTAGVRSLDSFRLQAGVHARMTLARSTLRPVIPYTLLDATMLATRPGTEGKATGDHEKLELALQKLLADDSNLATRPGPDGTVLLGADTEKRLGAVVERLVREFGVEAAVTGLDIAYRERLTRAAGGEAKYVTQSGGRAQYAHVKVLVEPGQPGSGY